MRVLVLAAHQDDEVLGCGATLARLVEKGHDCHVYSFALKSIKQKVDREVVLQYRKMCTEACRILGVTSVHFLDFESEVFDRNWRDLMLEIAKIGNSSRERDKPFDLVFIPWHLDLHQDHRAVSTAARFCLRGFDTAGMQKVLMYPCPGSTGHDFSNGFQPDVWIPVSEENVKKKLDALKMYTEEQREGFHPRSGDIIEAGMRVAGATMGVKYAEVFKLYRERFDI